MPAAVGTRFGRYELLKRLGAGGMGEVFRARDHDLHRDVAIKFLPARFVADPDRLARFTQEARAASSLNHPAIVTIHEIGETAGLPYIVMELVEGRTLRAVIAEGRMAPRRVLDLGTQIAEGLAKAHAAGIVHRDLKPDNVMVTRDGFAKILDFGLAKLRAEVLTGEGPAQADASSANEETRLTPATTDGAILGTVGYMAPEQAAGQRVDYRSDQFSLGAILYEMATLHPPFRRETAVQTLSAIIEQDPAPISELAPAFPAPAQWIVERCLAKNPADRYASTLDLARELRGVREHLSGASGVGAERRGSPSRIRLRAWHGLVATLAIAVALLFLPPITDLVRERLHLLPLPVAKRIAVLPVHNPGGTPEDAAICDGLLDYVVGRLGELQRYQRGVWVVPAGEVRESGVRSPAGARRGLGVNLAVDITVQRVGGRLVVTSTLADVGQSRPRQLRGATTRVEANDVLLDRTVEAVIGMLDLELGPDARAAVRAGTTQVAEASALYAQGAQGLAHTPYERGLSELQRYDREQRLEQAINLFQAALARDPQYALAHAGLAEAYLRLYRLNRRADFIGLAEQHCQRALTIDPLVARPWLTLGILHTQAGKVEQALDDFRRALDRDPRNGEAYREQAVAYGRLNRFDEAEQAYRRAISLMPDSWANHSYYGSFLASRRRFDEAEAAFKRGLELAPDNARLWSNLGGAYYLHGRHADADTAWDKSVALYPTAQALSNLGTARFYNGQYSAAARIYENAIKVSDRDYRVWRNLGAAYYWAPGERGRAAAAYRKAIELVEQERRFAPGDVNLVIELADSLACSGDAARARALVGEAVRMAPETDYVRQLAAGVYETLGDRDAALASLDVAIRNGAPTDQIERDPTFAKLRADPRYGRMLQRGPSSRVKPR
jgi:serine/threonine-protein kinase